jgi:hypothetical protein
MTNMPPEDSFKPFGIVTVIICVPTYFLIGSLNSTRGLRFINEKTQALFRYIASAFAYIFRPNKRASNNPDTDSTEGNDPNFLMNHPDDVTHFNAQTPNPLIFLDLNPPKPTWLPDTVN